MSNEPNFIEQRDLRGKLRKGENVFVVDVRSAQEFDAGHVDGAIHIPAGELAVRVGELPRGAMIVTVCNAGGSRSCGAAENLTGLGYDAHPLRGGTRDWLKGEGKE